MILKLFLCHDEHVTVLYYCEDDIVVVVVGGGGGGASAVYVATMTNWFQIPITYIRGEFET